MKIERLEDVTLRADETRDPESGKIYCKICGKATWAMVPDEKENKRLVNFICGCGVEKRDRRYADQKAREAEYQIERNRDIGLQEPALRNDTFQNDRYHIPQMKIARKYAEHFDAFAKEGKGLIFWGDVGTGKTYLAACIANALLARGKKVMMTNFTRVVNGLASFQNGNAQMDELGTYDLLILDDLGVEHCSDFVMEKIFAAVDTRYRSQKPMIITTNLNLQELKYTNNQEKKRIFSRILQYCAPVCVSGKNLRQQQTAENLAAARKMLQEEAQGT